ncbi:AMP-binding protein [Nocardioides sp. TRM66260-LWL]|uniref:AMP-binding protein n=1 Tax=Nocardioides sp. TRM66260-LWL TaxID=2874478 RepID=UPI001CC357FE|nr:AMP-binding protein [Nocardioides sp. TRM66260-LWL]MBZ5733673.1 AMP-binding protein [Nocardioides sp. TRM66260-LWL]
MAVMTIGRAFSRLAQLAPDAVAVRCGDEVLTRAGLERHASALASRWVREGLEPDDVVAVALPNGVPFVVACVAAWKAGACVQPARPDRPVPGRPALVVGPSTSLEAEPGAPPPDLAAAHWKVSPTSGSTGEPRLVWAPAPARIDPERCVPEFMPPTGVQLVAGPLGHAAPFTYAMRGLMSGHELVLLPAFEPDAWLAAAESHAVTWALVTPSMMRAVLPALSSPPVPALPALERVVHLGARCPEPVKRAWLDWLGPERVWEVYAGTEAYGLTLVGGREWLEHPGTVGRGIAGTRLRIERADGTQAPTGEVGLVMMRRSDDMPWRTQGDLGRLDADGRLHLADRAADVVRLGDRDVHPADVEEVLEAHPRVRAAVVVGRDGVLTAVVQPIAPDAVALDGPDGLLAWCERLPLGLRPAAVVLTDEDLRDELGKARRSRWR